MFVLRALLALALIVGLGMSMYRTGYGYRDGFKDENAQIRRWSFT